MSASGRWRKGLLAMVPLLLSTNVLAQQLIKVSQSAWLGLAPLERALIQQKYVVDLADPNTFGIIIDNQGVNESTPGTNVGANLGGAVANSAYVDNALRGGNYSAVNQLAVGVLGAMIGSTLDSRPNAQYHFRYAVKVGSGDIKYFDETKQDAFRHPVGVCVSVPYIALVDQQLCIQTAASLRATYLQMPTAQPSYGVPPPPPPPPSNQSGVEKPVTQGVSPNVASSPTQTGTPLTVIVPTSVSPLSGTAQSPTVAPPLQVAPPTISREDIVYCRLGPTSSVPTTAVKCLQSGGTIQQ